MTPSCRRRRPLLPPLPRPLVLLCLLPSSSLLVCASSSSSSPTQTPTPNPAHFNPHDQICRDYLRTFLRGVTDARDECAGLLNAYDAADCVSEVDDDGGGGGGGGGRGGKNDPWRRWWHDLLGDDDFAAGTDDDSNDGTDDAGGGGNNGNATTDDDAVSMIDDYYENYACCSTIRSYYTAHCGNGDSNLSDSTLALLGIVTVIITCGFVRSLLRTFDIGWLPEAGGCILVGSTAALVVKVCHPELDVERMPFDDDLFLSILLPPIIFQATLAIDKASLRQHLGPVSLFAVLGTVLSALTTGGIVYGLTTALARIGSGSMIATKPIPFLDSMIFGALISSVDPVATLSVLSSVGVAETDPSYVLVFGESLLNDGVAIVLFRTLVSHLSGLEFDGGGGGGNGNGDGGGGGQWSIVTEMVRSFAVVTLGSTLVGLVCGAACTVYFRTLRGRHAPVVEVGTFFAWALVPYYVGDALNWSGIIAIMTAGFFVDVFVIGHERRAGRDDEDEDENNEDGACLGLPVGVNDDRNQTHMLVGTAAAARDDSSSGPFGEGGCLSAKARNHIGFVAEVIASLTETAMFAYLGLFLFTDRQFRRNGVLNVVSIVSCIVSRAVMVGLLSFVINVAHAAYGRCRRRCCHRPSTNNTVEADPVGPGSGSNSGPAPPPPPPAKFIDRRMQLILLLSGIRGAVSLALVENIPLYNAVTKEGSKYKAELKAMASSAIIFTVFVFGASTYFLLRGEGSGGGRGFGSCGRRQELERRSESGEDSLMREPLMESGGMVVEDHDE